MLGESNGDWRTRRRSEATAEIVRIAWELAREHGLGGMSLRDLAKRLGMATPSLYSYFDSKHALYDAMFADGWRAAIEFEPLGPPTDLRTTLHAGFYRWIRFALADPVRYQLLSQRTIPGFEPSAESWALAVTAYDDSFAPLLELVSLDQEDLDLITAFATGLISQQIANDLGGTRWVRHVDDVVDLLVYHFESKLARPAPTRRRRPRNKEQEKS
jgi:AcrR family transcriptional regulator